MNLGKKNEVVENDKEFASFCFDIMNKTNKKYIGIANGFSEHYDSMSSLEVNSYES
jgi:hypothetical protein